MVKKIGQIINWQSIVAVIFAVFFLSKPLYLYFPNETQHIYSSGLNFFFIGAIAIVLLACVKNRKYDIMSILTLLFILLYIVLSFLNKNFTFQTLINLTFALLVSFLIPVLLNSEKLKIVPIIAFIPFIIAHAALVFLGMFTYITNFEIILTEFGPAINLYQIPHRLSVTLAHANGSSAILCLCIMMCIYLVNYFKNKALKVCFALFIPVFFIGISLAKSRTTNIVFCAVLGLIIAWFVAKKYGKFSVKKIKPLLICVIAFFAGFLMFTILTNTVLMGFDSLVTPDPAVKQLKYSDIEYFNKLHEVLFERDKIIEELSAQQTASQESEAENLSAQLLQDEVFAQQSRVVQTEKENYLPQAMPQMITVQNTLAAQMSVQIISEQSQEESRNSIVIFGRDYSDALSFNGRTDIWIDTINSLTPEILLKGYNTDLDVSSLYVSELNGVETKHFHSIYLYLLFCFGVPGLLLFLVFIVFIFLRCIFGLLKQLEFTLFLSMCTIFLILVSDTMELYLYNIENSVTTIIFMLCCGYVCAKTKDFSFKGFKKLLSEKIKTK